MIMNCRRIHHFAIGLLTVNLLLVSCDLTEFPQDTASKENVFKDEIGLELYTNSFYNILPSANDITRGDAMADYSARRDVPAFIRPGAYGPNNTSGWSWGDLRDINYFLDNNSNEEIAPEVRNHHNGIARFFRALFYFEKVKRYGDVPWIDTALDIDDPALYGPRDSREMVMDRVLEDLDFAVDNIRDSVDPTRTLVTKDVVLALKSRVALFEGTFRMYHANGLASGLGDTADAWLQEAVDAAEQVIQRGNFSLYTGAGNDSYEELFKTDTPTTEEDMLTIVHDTELSVLHSANWWYTSSTYGVRLSFVRNFVNSYLMSDGTRFTDQPGYETMEFTDEVENRDSRLAHTIRTPGYTRIDAGTTVEVAPDFLYVYTGYHPHKWTTDDTSIDNWTENTNSVAVFRYSEVLLNYAEAKAELGTLTDADWAMTVGALRDRAGITGGLNTRPVTVDSWFQQTYFPDINDPVILEIRRERGIELALEGHRFYDLVRWKRGELLEMDWMGMYIPAVDQEYDLNEDGSPDVYFYTTEPAEGDKEAGVVYIDVTQNSDFGLTGGTSGQLTWRLDLEKEWEDYKYLYPIPENDRQTNPDLGQNDGW